MSSNPVDMDIGTPASSLSHYQNENLKRTQNQVNEVVGIMRSNVEKIMIRDEKLAELDERANQLNLSASDFQTTSRKIKRKYWWKNTKMVLILSALGVLILIIIIISIVGIPSSSGASSAVDSSNQESGDEKEISSA